MAQRQDLEAAAAAGVIAAEQVEPLHAFLASRRASSAALPTPKGEEELRFIRNFHDVFLSIGIAIFAVGMVIGGFVLMGGEGNAMGVAFVFALSAAAQWGLAEVFAKRRRLFLPSIVLCLAFVGFVTVATAAVAGQALGQDGAARWDSAGDVGRSVGLMFLISSAAACLAVGAFWARYRLPFSVGLLGFGLALLAFFTLWVVAPKAVVGALPWWSLLSGVALFAVGVWFDARDPERRTLLSDNGFWLHFAAAPLILNGALSLATGGGLWTDAFAPYSSDFEQTPSSDAQAAAITLGVVVLLGVISLLINRRALIVSALVTTGISIAVLMDALGLEFGGLAAATLLLLGGVVLLLGAGWHSARRVLLRWVKPDGFWARIFPPEAAAE